MNNSDQLAPGVFKQTFFHGTKADLELGDLLRAGTESNYEENRKLKHVYMTATLDAAIWGAELALGGGKERIYLVEPLGEVEDDPNLTDKKFPGNPTMSYRSEQPCRIVGEVSHWQGHPEEQVKAHQDALQKHQKDGTAVIDD